MNTDTVAIAAKQRCFAIIEQFPSDQLINVAVSLEAMHKMIDEAMDEAYCLQLYRSSFGGDNDEPISFEKFSEGLGLERK